jgi:hypothetical protein
LSLAVCAACVLLLLGIFVGEFGNF